MLPDVISIMRPIVIGNLTELMTSSSCIHRPIEAGFLYNPTYRRTVVVSTSIKGIIDNGCLITAVYINDTGIDANIQRQICGLPTTVHSTALREQCTELSYSISNRNLKHQSFEICVTTSLRTSARLLTLHACILPGQDSMSSVPTRCSPSIRGKSLSCVL